jgi:hypothetical protein
MPLTQLMSVKITGAERARRKMKYNELSTNTVAFIIRSYVYSK